MRHLALLAAAGIALAGCNSLAVSTVGQKSFLYTNDMLERAGGGRDLLVEVIDARGNSFPGGAAALETASLDALQRHVSVRTRFTSKPQNFDREYKVVLLFNGPGGTSGSEVCQNNRRPGASTGQQTHLFAVFCRNRDMLTEVDGYASGIAALGDARFQELFKQVTLELFPSREERIQATPE